jgi:xanthine dehydrogenase accessory factor
MIAPTPSAILRFLMDAERAGTAGTLITLTGIAGAAARGVGTQMAVLEDGRHLGSFSGGCIESAVIAEAQDVLASGKARTVRFGSGSPYIDIRLACGGGIDLTFSPRPDPAVVAGILDKLARREPARLSIGGTAIRDYVPPLRLIALGHGEDLVALTRLARAFGIEVLAFAPAGDIHAHGADGIEPLTSLTALPALTSDPWTAFVFLFHDSDWEEALLPQALALPGFYHGAVGSARTHRARIESLRAADVPADQIDRLRGSIGLIPATRDPATLALSILGELVQDYQACAGAPQLSFAAAVPDHH